jgi:TRAP transporter TAXI family solute receptor
MATKAKGSDAGGSNRQGSRRAFLARALGIGAAAAALTGAVGAVAPWLRPFARAQDPDTAAGVRFMRIGTGSTAGMYFPIGGLIANAISRPPGARPCDKGGSCGVPGLIAVAQSTGGSVENVHLLASGAIDLALCQADIAYWARTGTAVFADAGPMPGLLALARMYDEKIHLVVRADGPIERVEDLRGMRVALGETGSGTLADARLLLAAHGLGEADVLPVYDKPGPAADLMVAGEIDALFFIGAAPVTVVKELAAAIPIRLVGLSGPIVRQMSDTHPYLTQGIVPGGVYAGVLRAVPTLSVGAVLVTTDTMDDQTAYGIVRGLWHPNMRGTLDEDTIGFRLNPSLAPHGTGIPLHPGAERFYGDEGLLP